MSGEVCVVTGVTSGIGKATAGQRRVTADGYDEVFAVNHLAPFLLTNLLSGKLVAAGPARVITVTSDAHAAARLDLDDLQLERGWQSWRVGQGSASGCDGCPE
jgi:NAD(P)-dependent dehydrogenase (short-subunit alcohol dehydrogenase family)